MTDANRLHAGRGILNGMADVGRLHVVTDARADCDPLSVVAAVLGAGADTIQVRVPDEMTDRAAYELAGAVLDLCRQHGVTCLVNDRLDVALAIAADGAHVGADDLPVAVARRILGPDAVIGATARDPRTARRAAADGATYVGVGPAFATSTKAGLPAPIGPEGIAAVAAAIELPAIAIGGVTAERIPALRAAGAYGVAVVGAVSEAAVPAMACAELLAQLR